MDQMSFFGSELAKPIVNVASVPQRSPFRYPGGKTWLIPRIRRWLGSMPQRPAHFIEPFAGGGSVSLAVAFERLADYITMVEIDPQVASVWHTIIHGDAEALAARIVGFPFTDEHVADLLAAPLSSTADLAFQTIIRNRANHGGILAEGAGRIKLGENGRGIASRWYPHTLQSRIRDIARVRDRISFVEGDALTLMAKPIYSRRTVFFIDPPYTAGGKRAGSRLYTHAQLDHERLFALAAALPGEFLMTYDNADEIRKLARQFHFDTELVAMKNTHHARMTELLIGRELAWARS